MKSAGTPKTAQGSCRGESASVFPQEAGRSHQDCGGCVAEAGCEEEEWLSGQNDTTRSALPALCNHLGTCLKFPKLLLPESNSVALGQGGPSFCTGLPSPLFCAPATRGQRAVQWTCSINYTWIKKSKILGFKCMRIVYVHIGASKALMQTSFLHWCSSALHHLHSMRKGFIPPNAVQPDILCRNCLLTVSPSTSHDASSLLLLGNHVSHILGFSLWLQDGGYDQA